MMISNFFKNIIVKNKLNKLVIINYVKNTQNIQLFYLDKSKQYRGIFIIITHFNFIFINFLFCVNKIKKCQFNNKNNNKINFLSNNIFNLIEIKLIKININYKKFQFFKITNPVKSIVLFFFKKFFFINFFFKYLFTLKQKNQIISIQKHKKKNLFWVNKLIKYKKKIIFNNYYNFVLNFSFEKIFKNKFFLKILNNANNFNKINFINKKKYEKQIYKYYKTIDNFLFFCTISNFLMQKDINIFMNWFIKNIEKINLRNHRKFLLFIRSVFKDNESIFLNNFNIKGFFFDIRGKVGVAGNSKKRHFYFYIGKMNNSTKKSKIDCQQNIVRTFTGCLGLTMILNY